MLNLIPDTISFGTHSTTTRVQQPSVLSFKLGSHHNGSAEMHTPTSTTCARTQLEAQMVPLLTLGLTILPRADKISTLLMQPMDHKLPLMV